QAGPHGARCDLRCVLAAVSSDHHDDARGDARRVATRARHRRRRGASASSRHLDRRRAVIEPIADALHDAGRVSVSRSIPIVVLASLSEAYETGAWPTCRRTRGLIIMRPRPTPFLAAIALCAIASCTVGPDYVRPAAETPA